MKKLCIRTGVLTSCILNLIKGSLSSINPLLLSLFRFLVDILRPEFDVVGRLPDPSDIQFYFKGKDVSPVRVCSSFKQYLRNIC